MTEKPILFSGPMVRARLDGRKMVTRRVVKDCPTGAYESEGNLCVDTGFMDGLILKDPWAVEVLWVKETFQAFDEALGGGLWIRYAADGECAVCDQGAVRDDVWKRLKATIGEDKWRSPIFMPRSVSRIDLTGVTSRPERLQDITADEVRLEGVELCDFTSGLWPGEDITDEHWVIAFHDIWDNLNYERGYPWSANPWVRRIGFRRVVES